MTDESRVVIGRVPPLDETNAQVSLLGRIPKNHPVRLLALAVARGEPLVTVQPFIDALLDPSPDRWRIRSVAAWAISRTSLTPEQVDAASASLMDVLEQARPERWSQRLARALVRHIGVTFGGGALGTVAVFALFTSLYGGRFDPSMTEVFFTMSAMVAVLGPPFEIPASFLFDRSRDSISRAAAAEALGRLGPPECVGALAAALFDRSAAVREAAAGALHQVLPHLTPEHYGLFGSQSVTNLGRALNHADAQLVAKVLGALALVGTSHAIPFVRRVAQSGRTARQRDVASEVVRILEERQKTESVHSRLLRPTTSPDNAASILVRPSIDSSSELSEILVRPTTDG